MTKVITLFLMLISVSAHGTSCIHDDKILAKSDIIISLIPMKGELLLEKVPDAESKIRSYRSAIFEVEVYRVWKGDVQFKESLIFYDTRMFSLGDEYIVATSKNMDGELVVDTCTLTKDVYRENDWVKEKLGEPIYEFKPTIFSS